MLFVFLSSAKKDIFRRGRSETQKIKKLEYLFQLTIGAFV